MVNDKKGYSIALYAMMLALIFVAMMLDRLISLALPVSMALLTLTVTFSCCFWRNSWTNGVLACTFFGVASMIKGFIFPEIIPGKHQSSCIRVASCDNGFCRIRHIPSDA